MKLTQINFTKKSLKKMLTVTIVTVLFFTGCKSVPNPENLPPEMTIIELSQKGQESLDSNNYKAAKVYYQVIIDRYGTDAGALTAAEFEIAHILLKQKEFQKSKTMLETIVSRYESTGGASLPPEYLVLARNDLERIAKEAPVLP